MRGVVVALCVLPLPGFGAQYACVLDTMDIRFAIDVTQFAPAVNAADPPRRQQTVVEQDGVARVATPFILGDLVGYTAEALGGTQDILVIQPDGRAQLTNPRAGVRKTGFCTQS